MARIKKQISLDGIALKKGLETYVSFPVYSEEHVAENTCFLSTTLSGAATATTTATDWASDVINNTTLAINTWFKYRTTGSPYANVIAPVSGVNTITFTADVSGSDISHAGIYQKMSSLLVGSEYYVSIKCIKSTTSAGTCSFSTYTPVTPSGSSTTTYMLSSKKEFTTPTTNSASILTTTFTAESTGDVFLIDFTHSAAASLTIYDVSIKRKDDYLLPICETDDFGTSSLVLNQIITTESVDDEVRD